MPISRWSTVSRGAVGDSLVDPLSGSSPASGPDGPLPTPPQATSASAVIALNAPRLHMAPLPHSCWGFDAGAPPAVSRPRPPPPPHHLPRPAAAGRILSTLLP